MTSIIDEKIIEIKKNNLSRDEVIKEYMPFIVSTVSKLTGKYVKKEDSDEVSIALKAFDEAIDRFSPEKGKFIGFANLVIQSRLKDYFKKNQSKIVKVSLDSGNIEVIDDHDLEAEVIAKEEISSFIRKLSYFSISLEDLIEESPTHKVALEENKILGKKLSDDEVVVHKLYEKRKLPIPFISIKYKVTEKKIRRFRKFLTALVVVYKESLESIIKYIS